MKTTNKILSASIIAALCAVSVSALATCNNLKLAVRNYSISTQLADGSPSQVKLNTFSMTSNVGSVVPGSEISAPVFANTVMSSTLSTKNLRVMEATTPSKKEFEPYTVTLNFTASPSTPSNLLQDNLPDPYTVTLKMNAQGGIEHLNSMLNGKTTYCQVGTYKAQGENIENSLFISCASIPTI